MTITREIEEVEEEWPNEFEVGIDLDVPRDTPGDVLEALMSEINEAAYQAFLRSSAAAEWEIKFLGRFGEKV